MIALHCRVGVYKEAKVFEPCTLIVEDNVLAVDDRQCVQAIQMQLISGDVGFKEYMAKWFDMLANLEEPASVRKVLHITMPNNPMYEAITLLDAIPCTIGTVDMDHESTAVHEEMTVTYMVSKWNLHRITRPEQCPHCGEKL